jgi:hypothetical protein
MFGLCADSPVTLAEAAAALQLPPGVLESLTAGESPFPADADGTISIRQAFGASMLLLLPMLDVPETVGAAVEAARGAAIDGQRSLMLYWPTTERPFHCWVEPGDRLPLIPILTIPADSMLSVLVQQVAAHRKTAAMRLS